MGPPDPPDRLHRQHPGQAPRGINQGEHHPIVGVGPAWTLITPVPGSLLHAAFQSTAEPFLITPAADHPALFSLGRAPLRARVGEKTILPRGHGAPL